MGSADPVLQNLNHFNEIDANSPSQGGEWMFEAALEMAQSMAPGSELLIMAPETRQVAALWRALGHEVELIVGAGSSGDPRWIPTVRDNWDAAWVSHWFNFLPKPICQRLLGALFSGLRPGGLLFAGIWTAQPPKRHAGAPHFYDLRENDFASLLLQSGFETLKIGRAESPAPQTGWIARRASPPSQRPSRG